MTETKSDPGKLKVLFLTPRLPYPPDGGGLLKTYRMLQFLSKEYDLSLAVLLKDDDRNALPLFCENIPLKELATEEVDISRSAINLGLSYFKRVPLSIFRNHSRGMSKKVNQLAEISDVIFVDHFLMFQYVPQRFSGKVVLHEHNAEFMLWDRLASLEANRIKRLAIGMEAARVRKYEKYICDKADAVLCAPNDREALEKIGVEGSKLHLTYHLGDENLLSDPPLQFDDSGNTLLFIGTMTWEPNVDGLVVFVKTCWQDLRKNYPDLRLIIVGKNPDARITSLARKYEGIDVLGYVKNLEPLFKSSKVFISPLRFGSGMKVKVLNAMYRGMPVVTTDIGVEGLDVRNLLHAAVSKDIQSMSEGIGRLLAEKPLWNTIRDESRKLAAQKYTWARVFSEIRGVLEGPSPAVPAGVDG